MADLEYRIETVDGLGEDTVDDMFTLYSRYYDGTSEQLFRRDLAEKQYVIVLRDTGGRVQGFSTQVVTEHRFEGATIRTIYSGDTIVDHRRWGQKALAFTWLRMSGAIKAAAPAVPLYWFNPVMAYRTYRYMRILYRVFYPAHDRETPPRELALIDMLARERFEDAYDADKGLVRFPTPQGYLKSPWAKVPAKDRLKPDARFFHERNPGYVMGDLLICLAELAPANLRPLPERLFQQGMDDGF